MGHLEGAQMGLVPTFPKPADQKEAFPETLGTICLFINSE